MTHVWWTKFGANQSRNCWDTPVYVSPRWRLDLFYPNFRLSLTIHLMCLIFPANGIMIRSDATEILQFYNFVHLARKCLFSSILEQFWGILTTKIVMPLILLAKICSFPGDMHYEILHVKISSRVYSVRLFKEIITLKKTNYWQSFERLYFTHMGRNPPVIRNVSCGFPSPK